MTLTRRDLLLSVGATAVAAAAAPALSFAQTAASDRGSSAGAVLLNRNENPYGTFPSVHQAMVECCDRANRYAFPADVHALVDRVARLHSVGKDEIMVGMGSTELLRMAADAFTVPGRTLITADPTFESIGEYAQRRGANVIRVPLTANSYAHDLEAMLRAARNAPQGGLIYVCNPNNPTGSITPSPELAQFAKSIPSGYVLMIDEAYHHFAMNSPGYAPSSPSANVIVTRTFSKVYGMAGVRLGYGLMAREVAQKLRPWQLDNDINATAAVVGSVALDDTKAMEAAARRIVADREQFLHQAQARKIKVVPTLANFAMLQTGRPAPQVIQDFRSRNIQIGRTFPTMMEYVRVSFGTPEQMQTFWSAWDQIGGARAA